MLAIYNLFLHVVLEAGINSPEKEPKVTITSGEQPLLPAKEEDGAPKKSKLSEDNKFGHEQVKSILRSLLLRCWSSSHITNISPTTPFVTPNSPCSLCVKFLCYN